MALVVETGFGVIGADSYASVSAADAWWAARAGPDSEAWSVASTSEKEAALRDASTYIDVNYLTGSSSFVDGQGLAWPYQDTEYSLSALQLLRRAVMMIAPLALAASILTQAPSEAAVVSKTDKVGDISESRTYATSEFTSPTILAGRDVSFLSRMLSALRGSSLVIGQRVLG